MADYDLEALSLGELKKMQKDVAKAISTFEDRQKAEARAKVEALARDLGYSLTELVGTGTKSARTPAAPKYRHPENPALTWSGQVRNLWAHLVGLANGDKRSIGQDSQNMDIAGLFCNPNERKSWIKGNLG